MAAMRAQAMAGAAMGGAAAAQAVLAQGGTNEEAAAASAKIMAQIMAAMAAMEMAIAVEAVRAEPARTGYVCFWGARCAAWPKCKPLKKKRIATVFFMVAVAAMVAMADLFFLLRENYQGMEPK